MFNDTNAASTLKVCTVFIQWQQHVRAWLLSCYLVTHTGTLSHMVIIL